jgi:hypothetical protein
VREVCAIDLLGRFGLLSNGRQIPDLLKIFVVSERGENLLTSLIARPRQARYQN